MEGKFELQFEDGEYYLVDGNTNDTVATTDKVLLKEYDGYMKKLSIKNCEAVANGYDLDDIIEQTKQTLDDSRISSYDSFKIGFQKALEILGDKKFSEKDMSKAWSEGYHRKVDELNGNGLRYFDKFIQSLQQTEWDVEVEMEKCGYCEGCNKAGMLHCAHADSCGFPIETERPKLDKDGCLILKRK